jgi:hypothetical protein
METIAVPLRNGWDHFCFVVCLEALRMTLKERGCDATPAEALEAWIEVGRDLAHSA